MSFYNSLKTLHYQDKVHSLPKECPDVLPPLHVRIKPCNACSHNCWYCSYRADNIQLGEDMNQRDQIPLEKILEIIDDCETMGVKAITFSGGGEPFCYKYMTQVARRLSRSSIRFASLTNGSFLNGEAAELFARHASWVRVSMDGWDPESYARYRSVRLEEFQKVMTNIKNFQSLGGSCRLGVSYIVDHDNSEHVYEMISRLYDLGVNSVKVSPCIVDNDGQRNNKYHATIFQQVKNHINRAVCDYKTKDFEIFDAYHELEEKFDKSYRWCPFLQVLTVIGADLNVYSCQDKAYNQKGLIGSIHNQSFKDFWLNQKDKFFCIDPSRDCRHHCVANLKNRYLLEYLNADKDHLAFV